MARFTTTEKKNFSLKIVNETTGDLCFNGKSIMRVYAKKKSFLTLGNMLTIVYLAYQCNYYEIINKDLGKIIWNNKSNDMRECKEYCMENCEYILFDDKYFEEVW